MAPKRSKADVNRFNQALDLVRGRTNQPLFEMWFQGLTLVQRQPHGLVIGTPNRFVVGWLDETQPRELLHACVRKAFGEELTLSLKVLPRKSTPPRWASQDSSPATAKVETGKTPNSERTLPLFTPPARPSRKRKAGSKAEVLRNRPTKANHLRRASSKKIGDTSREQMRPLQWELVGGQWQSSTASETAPRLLRARVPGGWLLALHGASETRREGPALTWYPDPNHRWSITTEQQELALSGS